MSKIEGYSPGLEGVIAGETSVSTVASGLRYRGYSVIDLAKQCSFDEVAYLLLYGELPTSAEFASFRQRLQSAQQIPACLTTLFASLPAESAPMDVLRTGISVLANYDVDVADNSKEAELRKAERLLAQIPLLIVGFDQARRKRPTVPLQPTMGFAEHLLYLLRGKPADPVEIKAFDVSLIMYAEHEFNASTFAARVVASTEADLHAAVVAAVGALKGPLHGGANEKVMDVLQAIGGPENAEPWLRAAMARKTKIMGFGHRVYKTGDVRAGVLKEYAQAAAQRVGLQKWEETAGIVERILGDEKHLYPNLDWPAGRLYHALGLDISLYTPFFVAARITGWCAHIMEQRINNRIIRPLGHYIGKEERAVPTR